MTDNSEDDGPPGIVDALLMPLRLPGKVVGEIETVSRALGALQRTIEDLLGSLDKRAGVLVEEVASLQTAVERIEGKVDGLMGLESTMEGRLDLVRADLNERMLAVEAEVRGIRPPIEQMSRDVQSIGKLLPDPGDGPLARLKDTLTPS